MATQKGKTPRKVSENSLKNLQRLDKIDPERAREIRSKGGKKASDLIRKRKSMKENMDMLLSLKADDSSVLQRQARKMGISEEDIDNQTIMLLALFKKATKGDVAACKEIRSMVGELFPLEEESPLPDNNITIKLEFPDGYQE